MKLTHCQAYVKQFHTTGLVWAKAGGDAIMVARQPNKGEVRMIMLTMTLMVTVMVVKIAKLMPSWWAGSQTKERC